MADKDPRDPKGLIRESYNIAGITLGECRSIFLDWALSLPDAAVKTSLPLLLDDYGVRNPDHPMTRTLHAALADTAPPKRRGGRNARLAR